MSLSLSKVRLTRRRLLVAGLGLPFVVGGAAAVLRQTTPGVRPPYTGPLDRMIVADRPRFWAGLNYPWKTVQDFGTGGWGHSGVSNPTTYQEVDVDFANMAAQGVHLVKWRIFNDGRYSPEFTADGSVTGLDEYFMADLDAALEIASRHDVFLILTLFASGFWTADCTQGDVQLGGHAPTLLDARRRRGLIENAVVPTLRKVAKSERVLALEVIAEPEWGIDELHQEQDGRTKLPLRVIRDFVGELVQAVHQNTRALATVESNRFSNMHVWQGLDLDYYSYSWYDWLEPYEPLATPAAAAQLDRPIILGEYPAGGSDQYSLPEVLDLAYRSGYAGAFAWSYWGGDGLSRWPDVAPSFTEWTSQHWETTALDGTTPPSSAPTQQQPYPYSYSDFSLRVDAEAVVAEMKIDVASGEPYVPHAYLYALGNTQPVEDVRLTAAPGQPGRLAARFTTLEAGRAYSISLGIFNRADALRKWFNNVATFALVEGALTTPRPDTLASELGCEPQ